jgi:hypothetical protein
MAVIFQGTSSKIKLPQDHRRTTSNDYAAIVYQFRDVFRFLPSTTTAVSCTQVAPAASASGCIRKRRADAGARPPLFAEVLRAAKKALDPQDLLNPGVPIDP